MTIVMPTYGAPDVTFDAVKSLRRTVDAKRVRIVVVDDASAPEHQERLKELRGVDLVLAPENGGYSASVNLGLARAGDGDDVVVLNNDVIAHKHWLPRLQEAAYDEDITGIVGPAAALPRRADPVSRLLPQHGRARVVRPPLPVQARRPPAGAGGRRRHRRDRRLHVPAPRPDRRDRRLRRGLRRWATRTWTTACAPGTRGAWCATSRRRSSPISSRPPAAPTWATASASPRSASGAAGAAGSTSARCGPPTAGCGSST